MIETEPTVSAIIIFLNAEQFLAEAIESVFAQTYPDWELLLVDDGSTDGSSEIGQRYAAREPNRVRYLEHARHQNRGMSASRNLGIRNARGKYIAFLDADDVWLPLKLERQVALLDAHPAAAMLYGATEYWYSWTGQAEDRGRDVIRGPSIQAARLVQPPALLPLFLRGKVTVPAPCSLLVRREMLEQIGGFEDRFRGLYEDQAFYAKICLAAPVLVTAECWDRYRQHPDSSCAVAEAEGRAHSARRVFLEWLAGYLSEQGVEDASIWRALWISRWRNRHPRADRLADWSSRLARRIQRRLEPSL